MTLCRAAVFDGEPGQIELREFLLPPLKSGEILVRVLGCTLCGSDLHSFHGRRSVPTPTVLGHEIVGEIVEFDSAAPAHDTAGQPLRAGDRVAWAIVANCGECFFCQRNLPQKCLNAVKYGHEALRPGDGFVGGMAEYCVLAPRTSLIKLPAELPLSVACPSGCATATVAAALSAAGNIAGRHVCLIGSGMLGLTACAMARVGGAATVVCVDPLAERRALALRFGATAAVSPDELVATAAQVAGPHGFDVALEFSGNPNGFRAVWPLVRTGGVLVLIGAVFPAPAVELALDQVVRRELTIRGVHNYAPPHLAAAVAFLAAHHNDFPFAELVSDWIPLSSAAEAFRRAAEPNVIRVGVCPDPTRK